jgi:predicted outer membrane repeat protein
MLRRLGLSVILGLGALVVMLVMLHEARAFTFTFPGCGATLQACINLADPNDTIQIQAGTYITSVTLNKPVSLVGAGAGSTIIRALPNQRVMTVTGATISNTIVISGLTLAGGNITGTTCIQTCGGAVQITGTARPLLQNLVISSSVAAAPNLAAGGLGGGLYVHDGSPLTLVNVTVISNASTSNSGGGMYAGSPVTLTNVIVANNRAPNGAGGGLRAADAVHIISGRFIGNHSFNPGGAARVTGPLNAVGTLVLNNSAGVVIANPNPINGGALRADGDATLSNVRLDRGRVNNNGGGVYASGRLTMSNMLIIDNEAAKDGGGVYAVLRANLNGVMFSGNTAGNAGGGLFVLADASVTGSTFFSNTAVITGGGAYISGTTTGSLNTLEQNASQVGGGVYAQGPLDWSEASFLSNTAGIRGGGVFAAGSLGLTDVQAVSNTAGIEGGGLYAAGGATILGGRFESNQAVIFYGAGISADGPLVVQSSTFSGNRAPFGGGGIAASDNAIIAGSAFTGNVATGANCLPDCSDGRGGAVRVFESGALDISGSSFFSNSARLDGGAVLAAGAVVVSSSTFARNAATEDDGGALIVEGTASGKATVIDSRFNENSAGGDGGGIFANTPITVTRSTFRDNTAASGGGGVYAHRSATVDASDFSGNSADLGGGMTVVFTMSLSGTRFVANNAVDRGGGLLHEIGAGRIANGLFANNFAAGGGLAAFLNDSNLDMLYTTVVKSFNAFGVDSAILVEDGRLGITNTIIASHTVGVHNEQGSGLVTGDYNLLFNLTTPFQGAPIPGSHNVFSAPLFVNPALGDYHLAENSPAIDAGTDAGITTDFEGDVRPQGNGFDIGFDERLFVAPPPPAGSQVYLPAVMRND